MGRWQAPRAETDCDRTTEPVPGRRLHPLPPARARPPAVPDDRRSADRARQWPVASRACPSTWTRWPPSPACSAASAVPQPSRRTVLAPPRPPGRRGRCSGSRLGRHRDAANIADGPDLETDAHRNLRTLSSRAHCCAARDRPDDARRQSSSPHASWHRALGRWASGWPRSSTPGVRVTESPLACDDTQEPRAKPPVRSSSTSSTWTTAVLRTGGAAAGASGRLAPPSSTEIPCRSDVVADYDRCRESGLCRPPPPVFRGRDGLLYILIGEIDANSLRAACEAAVDGCRAGADASRGWSMTRATWSWARASAACARRGPAHVGATPTRSSSSATSRGRRTTAASRREALAGGHPRPPVFRVRDQASDVVWRLGDRAVSADLDAHRLAAPARCSTTTSLVAATGVTAWRILPFRTADRRPGGTSSDNLDDATALRAALVARAAWWPGARVHRLRGRGDRAGLGAARTASRSTPPDAARSAPGLAAEYCAVGTASVFPGVGVTDARLRRARRGAVLLRRLAPRRRRPGRGARLALQRRLARGQRLSDLVDGCSTDAALRPCATAYPSTAWRSSATSRPLPNARFDDRPLRRALELPTDTGDACRCGARGVPCRATGTTTSSRGAGRCCRRSGRPVRRPAAVASGCPASPTRRHPTAARGRKSRAKCVVGYHHGDETRGRRPASACSRT